MTEENRRHNQAQQWSQAREALEEARLLLDHDKTKGAVSRAYFAALHAARALLLSVGMEARPHTGVSHLVYQHFVEPGQLDPAIARYLRTLQTAREDADYETAAVFTQRMAAEALQQASTYLEQVGLLLA